MILVVMGTARVPLSLQFMTPLVRVHDPSSGLSLLVGVVIVLLILSCLATRKRRQERKYVLKLPFKGTILKILVANATLLDSYFTYNTDDGIL
jgi:hypothetical protein